MSAPPLEPGSRVADLEIPPISRTILALFAGASGDHNPIHIDLDVARSAGLSDVFAHGMLSMAYLGRLLTDNFPVQQIRSFSVRFTAITPVHGEPTCRGVVRAVDRVGDESTIALDLGVVLADGTPTVSGEAVISVEAPEPRRQR
ncbi:MaoC/PaaZ C-terminal domain-containing protein [Nocardioides sp. LHD-245]|uniref:MaoC/PaaZ C-terminal domain-containing protein n=1 Tax=Nocardioides sp. LHD-245 TaxID=3051387 RepID=UPI0027E0BA87|nr:MaoC/PaaZ C-terminal domain-containing protein [Nocardioides sp. LHD-245]